MDDDTITIVWPCGNTFQVDSVQNLFSATKLRIYRVQVYSKRNVPAQHIDLEECVRCRAKDFTIQYSDSVRCRFMCEERFENPADMEEMVTNVQKKSKRQILVFVYDIESISFVAKNNTRIVISKAHNAYHDINLSIREM